MRVLARGGGCARELFPQWRESDSEAQCWWLIPYSAWEKSWRSAQVFCWGSWAAVGGNNRLHGESKTLQRKIVGHSLVWCVDTDICEASVLLWQLFWNLSFFKICNCRDKVTADWNKGKTDCKLWYLLEWLTSILTQDPVKNALSDKSWGKSGGDILIVLLVMILSQLCSYAKMYEVVHFWNGEFVKCQIYFNKVFLFFLEKREQRKGGTLISSWKAL